MVPQYSLVLCQRTPHLPCSGWAVRDSVAPCMWVTSPDDTAPRRVTPHDGIHTGHRVNSHCYNILSFLTDMKVNLFCAGLFVSVLRASVIYFKKQKETRFMGTVTQNSHICIWQANVCTGMF